MGVGDGGAEPIGWWSPDPRGILRPADFRPSRSLRRSMRHYEIRVNTAFGQVLDGCADPSRDSGWITPPIRAAYERLHQLGWAHSIETWQDGQLAGGLYGIAIAGLFAGESMFHRVTDASKAAVAGLAELMAEREGTLIDVQWRTDHLASLGVIEIPRAQYLQELAQALEVTPRRWPAPESD